MLLNMKELLGVANREGFAVGAFNVCDSLLFNCVIEAAEELNSPVIIELAPPEFAYVGDEFFRMVVERMRKSKVPCVLHLDHGKTLQDCMRAIRCGFTSVMMDGSELSYEENIRFSKEISIIAHAVNVSVEGEIGTIGALNDSVEGGVERIEYTNPAQVIDFIERTDVDSLAIAIGTAHGIYPEGFVPSLRLDILKEIHKINTRPLVLHGGSSNKDEEIKEACQHGICKVNIASDYRRAFFEGVSNTLLTSFVYWTPDVYEEAMKNAKAVIAHKMRLFNSIDKAILYQ